MAKVNIYVPDDLLERVDADAEKLGRSRSSVVQEALASYITERESLGRALQRRADGQRALAVFEETQTRWAENDPYPDVMASELLRELRDGLYQISPEEAAENVRSRKRGHAHREQDLHKRRSGRGVSKCDDL